MRKKGRMRAICRKVAGKTEVFADILKYIGEIWGSEGLSLAIEDSRRRRQSCYLVLIPGWAAAVADSLSSGGLRLDMLYQRGAYSVFLSSSCFHKGSKHTRLHSLKRHEIRNRFDRADSLSLSCCSISRI